MTARKPRDLPAPLAPRLDEKDVQTANSRLERAFGRACPECLYGSALFAEKADHDADCSHRSPACTCPHFAREPWPPVKHELSCAMYSTGVPHVDQDVTLAQVQALIGPRARIRITADPTGDPTIIEALNRFFREMHR